MDLGAYSKFHCELNPIEKCWSQAKHYTRAHMNYTIQRLRVTVPKGLDSVTIDNIKNYFRKAKNYVCLFRRSCWRQRVGKESKMIQKDKCLPSRASTID